MLDMTVQLPRSLSSAGIRKADDVIHLLFSSARVHATKHCLFFSAAVLADGSVLFTVVPQKFFSANKSPAEAMCDKQRSKT